MVFFADLMQDHEKVISHMLQNNQFEEAIRKLENVVSKCTVERYNSDWFVFIWYSFHSDCWKMCFEAQLTSCDYNFSFVFFLYTCVMLSLRLLFQAEPKLVYKFSPQLMQHVPSLTVDMWRTLSTHDSTRAHTRPPLDPKRLIPSLVQYDFKPQQGQVSKQTIGLWIDPCNAMQTLHCRNSFWFSQYWVLLIVFSTKILIAAAIYVLDFLDRKLNSFQKC